jgi:hypothetical protein
MFENAWAYILTQLHSINLLMWVLLFFVSIVYDIFYTKSILHISKLNAVAAANLSMLLYLIMAFGIINYVKHFINIVPIILGAWIGTYGILKYEKYIRDKRRKEKQKLKKQT